MKWEKAYAISASGMPKTDQSRSRMIFEQMGDAAIRTGGAKPGVLDAHPVAGNARGLLQGAQITKNTLKHRPEFVEACIKRHLSVLPDSVKLVVVLGATTDYVEYVMDIMGGIPEFPDRNCSYACRVGTTPVIHVPHPSGGNSGSVAVFAGERLPTTDSEKNIPELPLPSDSHTGLDGIRLQAKRFTD
jgi:hypothetical protein